MTQRTLDTAAWVGSLVGAVVFTIAFVREIRREPVTVLKPDSQG